MHDVVVVGGGIAGLAAAHALRDLDVVLLEAGDRVGGRIRSEPRGRYWLNFGAHVFAGPGSATDRLVRDVGVEARDVPGVLTAAELDGRVVAGGRVETYPFRLPLSPRERLALARTGLRLRAAVARYDRVLRGGGSVLDFLPDSTFAEWLGRVPQNVDALLRATIERSSGEPEELAAGYGIGYFHLVWDRSGGLARNILGGPATLPQAVARSLGDRVRLGARVDDVEVGNDGVRIGLAGGDEVRARTAIVATPAHVTRAIVRDLPDETRDALASITYGSYVLAAFLTNETDATPWDRLYAIATAKRSFNMVFNMANVLRGGLRHPGGSLMAYSGGRLARRLWDADDDAVRERYLTDLDGVFRGVPNFVAETAVHRWEHGLPYVRPGRERVQRALERPLRRLALAGDYLGTRYTDTAIATGTAAAAAIRTQLSV